MFCRFCGKQLAEDETVCTQCGKPVADQTETVAAPVKKKRRLKPLTVIIAVVAACSVVVGAFFEPVKGIAIKTLGSNEAYLQFVEGKASETANGAIAKLYGSYLDNMKDASAGKVSATLNAGEKAIDLLESSLEDETADLDWFKSVTLDVDINAIDRVTEYAMGVKLNDQTIANGLIFINPVKGELFAGIPSFSDKYLKVKTGASVTFDDVSMEELKEALPSEETVNALLDKYAAIVYQNMDGVDKSTETVNVGEIQQKLTVLEVEIDHAMQTDIAVQLLETADEDKELAKIVKDFVAYLEEIEIVEDADMAYDDFKDAIDRALQELSTAEAPAEEETIALKIYVDGAHQVVGREVTSADGETTGNITVRDGKDFASEMKYEQFKLTAKGTQTKGVVSGECAVWSEGKKLCDIAVTDLQAKKDRSSGKLLITPSNDLLEQWGLDAKGASVVSLVNPELEMVFEREKDALRMEMNLLTGKELFVGITLSGEMAKPTEVELPKSGDTYKEEDAQKWLESFDLDDFEDKLVQAGVPKDLAKRFAESFQQLFSLDLDAEI